MLLTATWPPGSAPIKIQTPGLRFEVNMGSRRRSTSWSWKSPNSTTDYARDFVVQVSNDGVTWSHVASAPAPARPRS